jgi:signal transduction histidine kinase
MLFISGLFIYPGANHQWVMLAYTYGMWILIQAEVLIYIIYSSFPIRFQPKLVGFVFASVMAILSVAIMILVPFTTNAEDPANLAQRLFDQRILIRLMMIILGSAVFVLLVFPLILRVSLIQPLKRLLVGIRQADKGDLDVKVSYGVLDEIGIVTRNFNGMVQSLKQSKDQLTSYANTLENKVAERTTELRKSLNELRATQTQLIHSEKMASLGVLTAGIAHEIQNPLNFVNNFSEVNMELLREMKEEIDKKNFDEVSVLANEILQNQEKINHHGKRADGIVKGMLQHSKRSTGKKEPFNINALAEEYLRLSYHGLRAKDKSFQALYETDLDNTMGKVEVVPQDLGRVFLNLFNNAFYSVNEKRKTIPSDFQPKVQLQTKRINDKIEIRVRDNGSGIPSNAMDKIFQPFFTTKPTGEGTGLGLSLSYDIITKEHHGEMIVNTREGEFAEFIIVLPATAANQI